MTSKSVESSEQLESPIRGTPSFDSPSGYLEPDPCDIRSLGLMSAYLRVDIGATTMSSPLTGGDNLVATGVRANFVRAKVVSITGGSGLTVQILG